MTIARLDHLHGRKGIDESFLQETVLDCPRGIESHPLEIRTGASWDSDDLAQIVGLRQRQPLSRDDSLQMLKGVPQHDLFAGEVRTEGECSERERLRNEGQAQEDAGSLQEGIGRARRKVGKTIEEVGKRLQR